MPSTTIGSNAATDDLQLRLGRLVDDDRDARHDPGRVDGLDDHLAAEGTRVFPERGLLVVGDLAAEEASQHRVWAGGPAGLLQLLAVRQERLEEDVVPPLLIAWRV